MLEMTQTRKKVGLTSFHVPTEQHGRLPSGRWVWINLIMPFRVSSLRPMLKTVSIIPGIENFAPELQETRSGFWASPFFSDR
jgi:hypothetical protein